MKRPAVATASAAPAPAAWVTEVRADALIGQLPKPGWRVARELGRRRIAFLCAREHVGPDSIGPQLKAAFGGVYIANEQFTRGSAQQAIDASVADAVAFGKLFLANPDLSARFLAGSALNAPRTDTFYRGGASGYTDYPTAVLASGA